MSTGIWLSAATDGRGRLLLALLLLLAALAALGAPELAEAQGIINTGPAGARPR